LKEKREKTMREKGGKGERDQEKRIENEEE